MQSNRSCHKVKRPRWQRNSPVSNPQSGCICEIREICGLIIFLLRKKNSIDTVPGGDWQTRELLENFASQPPKHPNPRTSLAAGNYRSYASDKVQLNTCAANGRQRSLNRRLEFFENFDPETPEKASTRQPLQEVHQWTKRAKRSLG